MLAELSVVQSVSFELPNFLLQLWYFCNYSLSLLEIERFGQPSFPLLTLILPFEEFVVADLSRRN